MEQLLSVEFIKQFGLAAAVIVFTLIKDWRREQRMQAQLDDMQSWIRMEMLEALRSSTRLQDLVVDEMTKRPCLRASEKLEERKHA